MKLEANSMRCTITSDPTIPSVTGLAREPKVGFIGFDPDSEREKEYLARLPRGLPSSCLRQSLPDGLTTRGEELITDLFIAGSGEEAARVYRVGTEIGPVHKTC